MMFNKKIFIAMILLLTFSCGYQPIYSTKQINKNYDFSINKIDFNEENLIAQSIRTNLKTYLNLKEKNNNFNIKISTTENKKIVSRNKQSDVEIFSLEIILNLEIFVSGVKTSKINLKENFEYNNISNKFDLDQYEKVIRKNLSYELANDIVSYLYTLSSRN